jgi:lysophospholipase L1-like esterase
VRSLAALCWLLLVLVGCAHPAASTLTSQPRVVVIGDSYSAGAADGGGSSDAWPAMAWKNLTAQGVPVSLGVAAEGGSGYIQRGVNGGIFGEKIDRAVGVDDALVVLFGSGNDEVFTPDQLGPVVRDDLARVKALAPRAKVMVIGPCWPYPDPSPEVRMVRDVLRDQAAQAGAIFVDPIDNHWLQVGDELIGVDHIHPTVAGQKYLADKIAPLIKSQLTANAISG